METMDYRLQFICAISLLAMITPLVQPNEISTRLFKARKAKTNEYPFVVWIERSGELTCSGSHVADEWVLTAAQCVDGISSMSDIRVVLGDTLVRNQNDGQVYSDIDMVEISPGYDGATFENDMALLRLTSAINTSPKNLGLAPSLMTFEMDDIINNKENCMVIGFGETSEGTATARKMKLGIRVEKERFCDALDNYNSTSRICFKPRRGKGTTCKGDEGAPILCPVNGTDTVVGINSDGNCSNPLMLATKMSEHIAWLNQIIADNSFERCTTFPEVLNGTYTADGPTVVDSTAELKCDSGLKTTTKNTTITCQAGGNYTEPLALCGCGRLPSFDDGSFETNGTNAIGDDAVLKCDDGYIESTEVMSDLTITCLNTGSWSSANATCEQVCGDPDPVANATFEGTPPYLAGATVILRCDPLFTRSVQNDNKATITCRTNGRWTSLKATCDRTCDALSLPTNGVYESSENVPVEGDTAVLNCNGGYLRNATDDADATITCDSNGQWDTTTAICQKVCDALPNINNGSFANQTMTPIEGDTAILQCDGGYLRSTTNDTEATITCDSAGTWDSTAAMCYKVCDALPNISNGSFANQTILPIEGDTAILQCDGGYLRSATNDTEATITCDTSGTWGSTAAMCYKVCDTLPNINNGSFANQTVLPIEGDTAILQCDGGYLRSTTNDTEATITCDTVGTWGSTAAMCYKVCDALPNANNGSFANQTMTPIEGDTAILQCDGGYMRSTENDTEATITCDTTGTWGSTAATCYKVCEALPDTNNGTYTNQTKTPIEGDTAVLQCDGDYIRSVPNDTDATITCDTSGTWGSTGAICFKVCDALPNINNGSFANQTILPIEGDTAILQCDGGYLRSTTNDTEATITCDTVGTWDSTAAVCERTCGSPTIISNGTFVAAGGLLVNDTAVLGCDVGFLRTTTNDTEAAIVCQSDGQWSSTAAVCVQGCGSPANVTNGNFTVNGTTVGDVGSLVCDTGYAPTSDNNTSITCTITGSWSSIATTCEKSCSIPTDANNSTFDENRTYFVNDTVVFNCDAGFRRNTPNDSEAIQTCADTGNWTETSAFCIRLCYSPPAIANGTYNVSSESLENATAILTCDAGYVLITPNGSDATITCLGDGTWSTTNATCARTCGTPPSASNGTFGSNTTIYLVNDTAELVCDSGYTRSTAFVAEASVTCQEDGNWDTSSAYCVESCSSMGTSFMVSFFKNIDDSGSPRLFGSVYEPTEITIRIPKYDYLNTLSLTKFISVGLSDDLASFNNDISNVGIEITASKPINLYIHHTRARSYEGTLIFPESCAKKQYILATHDSSFVAPSVAGSESVIVALEDGTTVTINEQPSGRTRTETLDRFDVLNNADEDLSGTVITADKNIQVFAGHRCANIPDKDTGKCDYIIEQMPPMSSLRRAYLLTYQEPRTVYSVRVVAPYENTDVTFSDVNGTTIKTVQLNASENTFEEFRNSDTISVTSTKDILVAQYAHGSESDDSTIGDPSYVVMASVTQFVNNYILMIDTSLYNRNYIAIFIRDDDDISGLRVADAALTSTSYETADVPGVGKFKVIHEKIEAVTSSAEPVKVTHTDSNVKFGVLQYGFSPRLGYALMAGRDLPEY